MKPYWCQSCQAVTFSSFPHCSNCQKPDDVFELTEEYAEERLGELREYRMRRDARPDPRPVRCPSCGGSPLGDNEQRYLSSGGVRGAGRGSLAGQPRNLTGGSTAVVRACRCQG